MEWQVRAANVVLERVPEAVEWIVGAALSPDWSLPLGPPSPSANLPPCVEGTSKYSTAREPAVYLGAAAWRTSP